MYSQLAEWHRRDGRLTILLYPSDEFGGQELPSAEIPGFVSEYLPLEGEGVHLMAKVAVNGEHADPVWSWLTTGPFPGEVGWNFDAVFLLDAEGVPVGRYSATELEKLDGDLSFLVGQS